MKILVTGSSGLIGSEAVLYFDKWGHYVYGVDNNYRKVLFGTNTNWNLEYLKKNTKFSYLNFDIRERNKVFELFNEHRFDVVIHCAAQPSHDKAKEIPLIDFEINAMATLNLLEATRYYNKDSTFIFTSTNKVYGSAPNEIPMIEKETRWDYEDDRIGIDENCRIDQTLHSLFGASKTAADILAQEYGRYFGMNVGIFRAGCITGERHSPAQLHGYLAYLAKVAKENEVFTIFGYKGKQVRDQLHASDLVHAFSEFINSPRQGEVYNIGGGRQNSGSILENIKMIESMTCRQVQYQYVPDARLGDHICYITDFSKFKSHYPNWKIRVPLYAIVEKMLQSSK